MAELPLRITAPAERAVVNPGQTFFLKVAVSGTAITSVSILTPDFLVISKPTLTAAPYEFLLKVPAVPQQLRPGIHPVSVVGTTNSGPPIFMDSYYIDVERLDAPRSVSVDFSEIHLAVGEGMPLHVIGTYSDGAIVDVSESTQTKYESTVKGVVSISKDGSVSAIAAGSTTIIVRHKGHRAIVTAVVTPSGFE